MDRTRKPRVQKQTIQTAELCAELNRMTEGFQQVFSALEVLQSAGVMAEESLHGCRLLAEQASSWACHQIAEVIRERELGNWTRAENEWRRWQKQNLDVSPETRVPRRPPRPQKRS